MAKQRLRDNIGRFQKQATIVITKQLEKAAGNAKAIVVNDIQNHLLKVYKENVAQSYSPRSEAEQAKLEFNRQQKAKERKAVYSGKPTRLSRKKMKYTHTGLFLSSIYTTFENNTVKVKIRDLVYPNGKSTTQIYEYLTKGTEGGGVYPIAGAGEGEQQYAYNYKTPEHLFEEHTANQMKGYLTQIQSKLNNDTYLTARQKSKLAKEVIMNKEGQV